MRTFDMALCALLLVAFLCDPAYSAQPEQPKCKRECQEQYVRQFAKILSKTKPTMADYFVLFREPEGPEGLRLFNITKKRLITGEDKDHIQEMTLAGDAFDEVLARDKGSRSLYLTCVHKQYVNHLPSKNATLSISISAGVDNQLITITLLSKKISWKFVFSDGELQPDSVITPDGITLGDMAEDQCVQRE